MSIQGIKASILDELKRGPAIAADLADVLGSNISDTAKALRQLREEGAIVIENGAYMLPDENKGKRTGKSNAKSKDEAESKPSGVVIEKSEVRVVAPKIAPKPYKGLGPSAAEFSGAVSKFIAASSRSFSPSVGNCMTDSLGQSDPMGIDQHTPGAKLDAGKPLAGVLLDFGLALESVSRVGTFGAVKYTRGGWQSVPGGEQRYEDAAMRHLLRMRTERIDSETGMPHLWAAAWNMLAVIELQERGDNDTRNHS
jgi:hypothetical protein